MRIWLIGQKSKEPEFNEYIGAFTSETILIDFTIKAALYFAWQTGNGKNNNAVESYAFATMLFTGLYLKIFSLPCI
ncbi:MAG: hypothetical protein LBJ63_06000 [Prevotellaceae bacterium]|jgi:hypothetical protein|nr:hypothetical protein [Prevotellaceae bacterium]